MIGALQPLVGQTLGFRAILPVMSAAGDKKKGQQERGQQAFFLVHISSSSATAFWVSIKREGLAERAWADELPRIPSQARGIQENGPFEAPGTQGRSGQYLLI
jgi:hypothetical protein